MRFYCPLRCVVTRHTALADMPDDPLGPPRPDAPRSSTLPRQCTAPPLLSRLPSASLSRQAPRALGFARRTRASRSAALARWNARTLPVQRARQHPASVRTSSRHGALQRARVKNRVALRRVSALNSARKEERGGGTCARGRCAHALATAVIETYVGALRFQTPALHGRCVAAARRSTAPRQPARAASTARTALSRAVVSARGFAAARHRCGALAANGVRSRQLRAGMHCFRANVLLNAGSCLFTPDLPPCASESSLMFIVVSSVRF